MQRLVHNAPLCYKELRAVPVVEIEFAERLLMEGLNYEFHCYHVTDIIEEILLNNNFSSSSHNFNDSKVRVDSSPRSAATTYGCNNSLCHGVGFESSEYLRLKALDIAQRAYIFSDAPFLYAPRDIAFAIVAIASGSTSSDSYCVGSKLLHQYNIMNPEKAKAKAELSSVTSQMHDVIFNLLHCPYMALCPTNDHHSKNIFTKRAEELRRVMSEVATLRLLRKMNCKKFYQEYFTKVVATAVLDDADNDTLGKRKKRQRCTSHVANNKIKHQLSKRARTLFDVDFTPPHLIRSYAKITPSTIGTGTECYYFRYNSK